MKANTLVEILTGFSVVLNNPKLGGGSNVPIYEASALLGLLALLISEGTKADAELKLFAKMIKEMTESSRAPTFEEWSALRNREAAALERLAKVKGELETPKVEEEPSVDAPPVEE